jgi:hypothetical protein
MNMKKKLIVIREQAIKEAKLADDKLKKSQKLATEDFLEKAKNRLQIEFNKNHSASLIEISFEPQADKDSNLIKKLYEENLLNEEYLIILCEKEGIKVDISKSGVWYPSFTFSIDFEKEKTIYIL